MTAAQIKRLIWEGKDRRYRVSPGLYVQVRKGSKTFLFRQNKNGKTRIITLGRVGELSLTEAKQRAHDLKYLPFAKNILFKTVATQYLEECRLKQFAGVKGQVTRLVKAFGNYPIETLERGQITAFLRDEREHSPSMAMHLLNRLKMIFNFAVSEGICDTNIIIGIPKSITRYEYKPRDRVLSDSEIVELWTWDHKYARILRFLLLTGLRFSEAQNGYVDGDLFRVDTTKNGKPHWVYLTPLAKEQLPIPKAANSPVAKWLRERVDYHCHDCRRTFVTIANKAGIKMFVVEKSVGHRLQGVMATYNQHDYPGERIVCFKAVETYVKNIS